VQHAVPGDDDGDGARHLVLRHLLLHGRADAGELRPLGGRGEGGGGDQGGDAEAVHGEEM
jgi:hypothetical protein